MPRRRPSPLPPAGAPPGVGASGALSCVTRSHLSSPGPAASPGLTQRPPLPVYIEGNTCPAPPRPYRGQCPLFGKFPFFSCGLTLAFRGIGPASPIETEWRWRRDADTVGYVVMTRGGGDGAAGCSLPLVPSSKTKTSVSLNIDLAKARTPGHPGSPNLASPVPPPVQGPRTLALGPTRRASHTPAANTCYQRTKLWLLRH